MNGKADAPRTKGRRASDHSPAAASLFGFELKREISIPTLLALLGIGAGIYGFYFQQGVNTGDIKRNSQAIETLKPLPGRIEDIDKSLREMKCAVVPQLCRHYYFEGHSEIRDRPPDTPPDAMARSQILGGGQ